MRGSPLSSTSSQDGPSCIHHQAGLSGMKMECEKRGKCKITKKTPKSANETEKQHRPRHIHTQIDRLSMEMTSQKTGTTYDRVDTGNTTTITIVHPSVSTGRRGIASASASTAASAPPPSPPPPPGEPGDDDDNDSDASNEGGRAQAHGSRLPAPEVQVSVPMPMYTPSDGYVRVGSVADDRCCGMPVTHIEARDFICCCGVVPRDHACCCGVPVLPDPNTCSACRPCGRATYGSPYFIAGCAAMCAVVARLIWQCILATGHTFCGWEFVAGLVDVLLTTSLLLGTVGMCLPDRWTIAGKARKGLAAFVPLLMAATASLTTFITLATWEFVLNPMDQQGGRTCRFTHTASEVMPYMITGVAMLSLTLINGAWWLVTECAKID